MCKFYSTEYSRIRSEPINVAGVYRFHEQVLLEQLDTPGTDSEYVVCAFNASSTVT